MYEDKLMWWHILFKNSCILPNTICIVFVVLKNTKLRKPWPRLNISSTNPTAGFLCFEHYIKTKIKAAQRNKQKNLSVQGTEASRTYMFMCMYIPLLLFGLTSFYPHKEKDLTDRNSFLAISPVIIMFWQFCIKSSVLKLKKFQSMLHFYHI